MSNGLPQKPDAITGEPRPPRAPLPRDWRKPEENYKRALSKVPHPPEGSGSILESFHPTIASSYTSGFWISLAMLGLMTMQDFGFEWVHVWWLWLFVVPWPFFFVLKRSRIRISAGANWLMYGKSGLVRTYELTKINLEGAGWEAVLEIEDARASGSGRRCGGFSTTASCGIWSTWDFSTQCRPARRGAMREPTLSSI